MLWARNRYAHGQLITWAVRPDPFADPTTYEHRWFRSADIVWDVPNAIPDETGEKAYNTDAAGRSVAMTLRAELSRLVMLLD